MRGIAQQGIAIATAARRTNDNDAAIPHRMTSDLARRVEAPDAVRLGQDPTCSRERPPMTPKAGTTAPSESSEYAIPPQDAHRRCMRSAAVVPARRIGGQPRGLDDSGKRVSITSRRLDGDQIAPVDGGHRARPVILARKAPLPPLTTRSAPTPSARGVEAADQIMERGPAEVACHQVGHDLRQRADHRRDHALADLAMGSGGRGPLHVDDGPAARSPRSDGTNPG